ncbi:hypothetical protein [Streptomyces sp. NRRL F-5650]|uniref:hypothetical protein n=1 Tax=Streptomyces sp. NRRL F-5650 TaxID=1463868 RepID=UPI0004C4E483|nr:hypothetical protein [Streptomyces sp. NRRL F-5650]
MHEQSEVFAGRGMDHPVWCSPAYCTAPARYAVDEWAYEEFVGSDAYRGSGYEHASEPWQIPAYAGFHPLLEQLVHETMLTAQLTQFAATPWLNDAYVSLYAGEERLLFISEVWVQRILGGVTSRLQSLEGNSAINNKSV